nr:unnamed protein product [Digitaria exilis]
MARRLTSDQSPGSIGECDRLSKLPDDLLHHILRFLDSRQAVTKLSTLSRRWRYLWATTPSITLRSGDNVSEKFGNLLLLLRDGAVPLRTFCLHSYTYGNCDYEYRWLRHAVTRGLCVLEINLRCASDFQLPECVFGCATLEEFNLSAAVVRNYIAPRSICLPSLKKMHLNLVEFVDPYLAENINIGCPALEDLSLSRCSLGSFKMLSETLKILSITHCYYEEIHVSAPNVCSLRLTVSRKVHLDAMPFLVSAWVYLYDGGVKHLAQNGYDLAAALCNGHHLELFGFNLFLQDVIGNSALEGLSFCKLQSLYIGERRVTDFYGPLAYFLRCAPNLVALTMDQWKLPQLRHMGNTNLGSTEKKPTTELKLVSALTKDLERLLIRLSKSDDIREFRKMRRLLKEKTKPKEIEIVWF